MQWLFQFDTRQIANFFTRVGEGVNQGFNDPHLQEGGVKAQAAYLNAMRARAANEGDGSWPQLAPATQKQRKWLGFGAAHPILRRLGILLAGLVPGMPGNAVIVERDRIRAGYGGDAVHPGYKTPTGKTTGGGQRIADIALKHQLGGGRLPARPILVNPSQATEQEMAAHLAEGLRKLYEDAASTSTGTLRPW